MARKLVRQVEVVVLAFGLTQPLTSDPMVGNLSVAIGARHVELTNFACAQLLSSLKSCFRFFRLDVSILIGVPLARKCR